MCLILSIFITQQNVRKLAYDSHKMGIIFHTFYLSAEYS